MNSSRIKASAAPRTRLVGAAVFAVLAACAPHAFAQSSTSEPQVDGAKLVEILVANGVITREQANQLLRQAASAPAANAASDVQTIPYVPEPVRRQIKEEVRAELAEQGQREGWAAPGALPQWTRRITLDGDVRVRGEGIFFDEANYPDFVNFGAINEGGGYDISAANAENPPYLNTTEDRSSMRIRLRFGATAQVAETVSAQLQMASGNDRSPVSTNQTLGNGGTGKYSLWLDRANIEVRPLPGLRLEFGRAENPFWTSPLLFDTDLNFDGLSARFRQPFGAQSGWFGTVGAFPVFNTALNFGSRDVGSFESKDKYLLAAQLGTELQIAEHAAFKFGAGYFYFDGVQGERSSPCAFDQDVCDTDPTRPQFTQFGNTLFPIRNVIPDPLDPLGSPEIQYFGLAAKYEILNLHAAFDFALSDVFGIQVEGDYVSNLAFDRELVAARAVNNLGAANGTDPGRWDGGDKGWFANLVVGNPRLDAAGDWNLAVGYRYLESDAVLDAFTDSDFHLGGTNAKGYIVRAGVAFAQRSSVNVSWFSANEISGAPYSNELLQLDLNTRF